MKFRVTFEFDIDRSSPHIWTDDEQGVQSVEELVTLMLKEEDIEVEELEVERVE